MRMMLCLYMQPNMFLRLVFLFGCLVAVKAVCSTDKECHNGCCYGLGKLRFCRSYLQKGERCTINIGCGCKPGLTCLTTGALKKRCVRLQTECGKQEIQRSNIIEGERSIHGMWPWQVLIKFVGTAICGGTLISPEWVITSTSCVYRVESHPHLFSVVVGEYNRLRIEGTEQTVQADKIFSHPSWSPSTYANDIALIKLKHPVNFNRYVQPACLPTAKPKVGADCFLTGWGTIDWNYAVMVSTLQQGKFSIVSNEKCQNLNFPNIGVKVTDDMVCAGDGGKSPLAGCKGDKGGPLVCNTNGRWEVHGDFSYGSPNCNSTLAYTVFTRVHYFMRWIYETTSYY